MIQQSHSWAHTWRERKNTCTPMFVAAVFTTARTWKGPKRPSMAEWIKRDVVTYTMEYHSAIKKNEIMLSAATWMGLEIILLSEVRKRKKKQCILMYICGILKKGTNELIYKTEIESQMQKTNLRLSRGKRVGRLIVRLGLTCTHYYI